MGYPCTMRNNTKFYVAAPFSEQFTAACAAEAVTAHIGWECTARWVYGGETGLKRNAIAMIDLADVDKADALIVLSKPHGTLVTGGGRWVEFGYALARGKECYVIGHYENVFCHHPLVRLYPTLQDMLLDRKVAE